MKYKGKIKIPDKRDFKSKKSPINPESEDFGKNKKQKDIRDEFELVFDLSMYEY